MHNQEMDYRDLILAMMKTGPYTQAQMAAQLNVSQPTISRWLKGARPDMEQHRRIVAEVRRLAIPVDYQGHILSDEIAADLDKVRPPPKEVPIIGYVGAGAEAHYYAVSQGELERVPAPEGSTPETVAAEIRGTSLGPLFDRWLIFFDDIRMPVTDDLLGKVCIVGLADDRVLIKRLQRGPNGKYTLSSETEPEILNASVQWAAKVKNMVPR